MTSISYETIFNLFLGNVTDYKLASLNIEDATALMGEWLRKALAETYLNRIFSKSTLDDENQIFAYTLKYAPDGDEDNFVANAIAKWMTYEWIANQVNATTLTNQMVFSSKEKSYYSQANHLSELRALRDDLYKEARFFVQDRGWIKNSYLGGK